MKHFGFRNTSISGAFLAIAISIPKRLLLFSFCLSLPVCSLIAQNNDSDFVPQIQSEWLSLYWENPEKFEILLRDLNEASIKISIDQELKYYILNPSKYAKNSELVSKELLPIMDVLSDVQALKKELVSLALCVETIDNQMFINTLEADITLLNNFPSLLSELSDYVLQYRRSSLRQAYYAFKFKSYTMLLALGLKSEASLMELTDLVSAYLAKLYGSGLINSSRKNQLTSKYQLIEQMLDFLSTREFSLAVQQRIEKILMVSRMGEFNNNRNVITLSATHKPMITSLLLAISPIETKLRKKEGVEISERLALMTERNTLREKYFLLIKDFYNASQLVSRSIVEGDANTTKIIYFEGERQTFQYIKNYDQPSLAVYDNVDLSKRLNPLISLISGKPAYLKGNKSKLMVIKTLLKSICQELRFSEHLGTSKNLIIDADGQLNYIPFEALIDADNDYLVQDHIIGYQDILSVGNEAFVKPSASVLSGSYQRQEMSIKYATQEVAYLKQELNATNLNYRQPEWSSENILHVTTHQVLDAAQEPVLLISELDSIHTWDFFRMKRNPQIINLNTCASLTGYKVSGEGTMSFGRRALEVGANQAIASLWEVQDKSTYQISIEYLESLKDGFYSSEALQTAKNEFLNGTDSFYEHPFFWSSLVHLGQDIVITKTYKLWYLSFLLLSVFFVNIKLRVSY